MADAGPAVSLAGSTMGPGPQASGGYTATRTYADVFQDWPSWLADGTVDAVFPMNYFRDQDPAWRSAFDDWVAFERSLPRRGVLAVGQAAYLNDVGASLSQLARGMQGTEGAVVYSYQQTARSGDPRALLPALATGPFGEPAPAPALGWAARADTGHLLVRAGDGVAVEASGPGGSVTVVGDATGHAAFLHLAPGAWTLTAAGHPPAAAAVDVGRVTRVTLH